MRLMLVHGYYRLRQDPRRRSARDRQRPERIDMIEVAFCAGRGGGRDDARRAAGVVKIASNISQAASGQRKDRHQSFKYSFMLRSMASSVTPPPWTGTWLDPATRG
jgi:hypothetical protein